MAAESAGQIGLDLVVNQGEFKKQLAGIQGVAKKAGLTLAAAFSVKKLVDFGARCIELGSDIQEVQNVVDVTFPRMSKQVDMFAQGGGGILWPVGDHGEEVYGNFRGHGKGVRL